MGGAWLRFTLGDLCLYLHLRHSISEVYTLILQRNWLKLSFSIIGSTLKQFSEVVFYINPTNKLTQFITATEGARFVA